MERDNDKDKARRERGGLAARDTSASPPSAPGPVQGDIQKAQAEFYLRKALHRQSAGDIDAAVRLYERSIQLYPSAEAHTFLGWALSLHGKLDAAIDECKRAIAIDPQFGNPYNDIGAYLIEKGEHDAAIDWLKRAIQASRYESYHFPHYNLGRVYLKKGMVEQAMNEFARALQHEPEYALALQALAELQHKQN